MSDVTHCGYIALIGRPNVGKSTLLNRLIGEKVSITSKTPQTTRQRVLGIKTLGQQQLVYVDTPGMHRNQKGSLNRLMNKAADYALADVDIVILVLEAGQIRDEDRFVIAKVAKQQVPVIIALNKVDAVKDKARLLEQITQLQELITFEELIPLSALTGDQLPNLEQALCKRIPESPHFFLSDQLTDKSLDFRLAEMIREKIYRLTGQEVPHHSAIVIEKRELVDEICHIHALIMVEKEGQKRILIGHKGDKLKHIGTEARQDMQRLLGRKVFLKLWIKIKENWSEDKQQLRQFGLDE